MNNFRYTGNINPGEQVYDPQFGQANLTASAGAAYAKHGAQDTFNNVARGFGQKAAMDLGRANTQSQNQYYDNAANAQNRGALQGLQLLGEQQSNAYQRQSALENMQYKWMNDMMGGGLLGGLL
jgi:hypothetical protein